MVYTTDVLVSTMKYLNLFDDIEYKYIKDIINNDDDDINDEDDIEVEIKDLYCDLDSEFYDEEGRGCLCQTQFKFSIPQHYKNPTFTIVKEYYELSEFASVLYCLEKKALNDSIKKANELVKKIEMDFKK